MFGDLDQYVVRRTTNSASLDEKNMRRRWALVHAEPHGCTYLIGASVSTAV